MYQENNWLTSAKSFAVVLGLLFLLTCTVCAQQITTRQSIKEDLEQDDQGAVITISASRGQITKQRVEVTKLSIVNVINPTKSEADVDFVAFDMDDRELARETVIVEAGNTTALDLQIVFPYLSDTNLSTIEIQLSLRPKSEGKTKAGGYYTDAMQAPVAFFSQGDTRWGGNRLGTCSGETIKSAGCAITSIAMAMAHAFYNLNPATLNTYLTNNNGYVNGCLVVWSAPANMDGPGGFQYLGASTVGSASSLKSRLDSGQFPVVKSTRFASHYGLIIGYKNTGSNLSDFYYLDPQDKTAIFHYIGDGWVSGSSTIQVYK